MIVTLWHEFSLYLNQTLTYEQYWKLAAFKSAQMD